MSHHENNRESVNNIMKVAVTGARGYVGQYLIPYLQQAGIETVGFNRVSQNNYAPTQPNTNKSNTSLKTDRDVDYNNSQQLQAHFHEFDAVIHLAGMAHQPVKGEDGKLALKYANVDLTASVTEAAIAANVDHLIFLSSIKVNGEHTTVQAFSEDDRPAPKDAYGYSKWQAEQTLIKQCHDSQTAYTIIRPCLIYGPNPKGNLASLGRAISKGWPLPLAKLHNRRHLLDIRNLCSAIVACLQSPISHQKTYLLADSESLSTTAIAYLSASLYQSEDTIRQQPHTFSAAPVRSTSTATDTATKTPRLFALPSLIWRILQKTPKIKQAAARLCGNLEVRNHRICRDLQWHPPYSPFNSIHHMPQQGNEQRKDSALKDKNSVNE